jgi:hypothetical protein
MRKEVALVLAGVASFDLGTFVVPARAEVSLNFIKIEIVQPENFEYLKFTGDEAKAHNSCLASKGTPVEYRGSHYCSIPKAKASTGTAIPKR